jgi:hypothetical protein
MSSQYSAIQIEDFLASVDNQTFIVGTTRQKQQTLTLTRPIHRIHVSGSMCHGIILKRVPTLGFICVQPCHFEHVECPHHSEHTLFHPFNKKVSLRVQRALAILLHTFMTVPPCKCSRSGPFVPKEPTAQTHFPDSHLRKGRIKTDPILLPDSCVISFNFFLDRMPSVGPIQNTTTQAELLYKFHQIVHDPIMLSFDQKTTNSLRTHLLSFLRVEDPLSQTNREKVATSDLNIY